MDVFSLINSNAIREYLKKIDYKFDVKQIVYLIAMCDHITLAAKHDLYDKVMHAYDDVLGEPTLKGMTLFELLKKHILYQNDLMTEFFDNTSAVYITYCNESYLYSTYKKAMESIKRMNITCSSSDKIVKEKFRHRCDYIDRHTIDKYGLTRVYLNKYNDIVDIDDLNDCPDRNDLECNLKHCLFNMGIKFPIPFIKGDILYDPSERGGNYPLIFQRFVDKANEWPHAEVKSIDTYSKNINHSDQYNNYMDLEYYEDKLRGVYEKLKQYAKENIRGSF